MTTAVLAPAVPKEKGLLLVTVLPAAVVVAAAVVAMALLWSESISSSVELALVDSTEPPKSK